MKRKLLLLMFALVIIGTAIGQSVTATYTAGDIPTNYSSYSASCNGAATPLLVTLPGGTWEVTAVDVAYYMTAQNWGYMSEQRSMLACQESGTDEGTYTYGSGSSMGTYNYSRTGLAFANGVYTGNLTFELKAYRTYGSSPSCGTNYQKIDDGTWTVTVYYQAPPSCPAPTALTATPAATSASLGWTSTGTLWDIELGTSGFSPTGNPTATGVTNPYVYGSLTPATSYDYYVRTDCGGSDYSTWEGPFPFTTNCVSVSVSWSEGFEGMPNVGSGIVPVCMAEDGDWATANSSLSYNRFARTGTNYVYTNYNADDWLFTPGADLVGGTSYDFSFWYVTDGNTGWTTVEAGFGTGQTAGDMTNGIGIPVLNATNTTYAEYRGSFTPTTSGTYFVGIHVVANYSPWYISMDDLLLELSPACPNPTDQVASNFTPTSVDLGWTPGENETAWFYDYGAPGYGPPTGPGTFTTDNPVTISGLTANTPYDWYVRSECGETPRSAPNYTWTGPHTFRTACNTVMSFPYYEDFENGGLIPNCWTLEHVTGTSDWTYEDGGQGGHPSSAVSGSYNALLYHSSTTAVVTKLVSPALDLSTATMPYLIFWHAQAKWISDQDELRVYYKSAAADPWTLIPGAEWTGDIPDWTSEALALPNPSATYYIAFEATGQYGRGVAIDDVRVKASPDVPVSDWAIYLSIILIITFVVIRYRR